MTSDRIRVYPFEEHIYCIVVSDDSSQQAAALRTYAHLFDAEIYRFRSRFRPSRAASRASVLHPTTHATRRKSSERRLRNTRGDL